MKSRTASVFQIRAAAIMLGMLGLVIVSSCLPKPLSESSGGINITLYGFSIMKEPLEKAIYPAFIAKAKREHNIDIHFTSSFAGSETITNQILQGVKAQVAIFSIERDAERLQQAGFVTSDWHNLPQRGIVNKTPFVILVRKGNPKGIHDFADLAKPGVKLIHPDPVELRLERNGRSWRCTDLNWLRPKKQGGEGDRAKALQTLQAIWRNVIRHRRQLVKRAQLLSWAMVMR
jgi:sulfate transport system substrate-binding protein